MRLKDIVIATLLKEIKADADDLNKKIESVIVKEIDILFDNMYEEIIGLENIVKDRKEEMSFVSRYFDAVVECAKLLSSKSVDYVDRMYSDLEYKLSKKGIEIILRRDDKGKRSLYLKKAG